MAMSNMTKVSMRKTAAAKATANMGSPHINAFDPKDVTRLSIGYSADTGAA